MSLIGSFTAGSVITAAIAALGLISATVLKVGGARNLERTWRWVMQLIVAFTALAAAVCLVCGRGLKTA
jgi:hypothetical protein